MPIFLIAGNFMKKLIFFVLLIYSCFAMADSKLLVLVSVKQPDHSRDYYKFETLDYLWYSTDKDYLRQYIEQNFNTKKYSTRNVRPGECFVYYGERSNGKDRHFAAVNFNDIDSAKKDAQKRKSSGYTIIDVDCNNGVLSKETSDRIKSNISSHNKSLNEEEIINLLFTKNEEAKHYRCTNDSTNSFNIDVKGKAVTFQGIGSVNNTFTINNSGFDLNSPSAIQEYVGKLTEAYEFVCLRSNDSDTSFISQFRLKLRKLYNEQYKRCLKDKNSHDVESCQGYLKHTSKRGVRG